MIRAICPSCKAAVQAPDAAAGRKCPCPKCRSPIPIQAPPIEAPPTRSLKLPLLILAIAGVAVGCLGLFGGGAALWYALASRSPQDQTAGAISSSASSDEHSAASAGKSQSDASSTTRSGSASEKPASASLTEEQIRNARQLEIGATPGITQIGYALDTNFEKQSVPVAIAVEDLAAFGTGTGNNAKELIDQGRILLLPPRLRVRVLESIANDVILTILIMEGRHKGREAFTAASYMHRSKEDAKAPPTPALPEGWIPDPKNARRIDVSSAPEPGELAYISRNKAPQEPAYIAISVALLEITAQLEQLEAENTLNANAVLAGLLDSGTILKLQPRTEVLIVRKLPKGTLRTGDMLVVDVTEGPLKYRRFFIGAAHLKRLTTGPKSPPDEWAGVIP
jgi:hypothetical protein